MTGVDSETDNYEIELTVLENGKCVIVNPSAWPFAYKKIVNEDAELHDKKSILVHHGPWFFNIVNLSNIRPDLTQIATKALRGHKI